MALGEKFVKTIQVKVGAKGQEAKKDELVGVDREINRVEGEKAAEMNEFNSQLKGLRKQRNQLLDTIENGIEEQEIEVFERLNDKLQQVETIRVDTGKVMPEFTRALTAEERQLDISDLDPKGTGKRGRGKASDAGASAE
jgi:predicted phage-related endonuclease